MGFFSGILGAKKQQVPASGFYSQPQTYRDIYGNVTSSIANNLGNINAEMFTPKAVSPEEQAAIGRINQGFAPTQESLTSDISMQMNPFDQFVIDAINREAAGKGSVLQQQLQGAGQSGSNRQLLGANDIDLTRLQQIGGLKQGQYNQALQNALGTMTASRRQDAASQLGVGDFLRGLESETKQAPVDALRTKLDFLRGIPTQFGDAGSQARTVKTGGGLGGILDLAKTAGSIYTAFSDIRLKHNIKELGSENGHKVYEFSYRGDDKRYIGVMAQDVEKYQPDAVHNINGYLCIDYSKLGVEFREAA
jgi:hypothetical protein